MFSFFRKKKAAAPPPPPDPALVAEMKELWFRYGGNGFVIWHEDPDGSQRFHDAHIPDETIEAWRQEMISSEFTALTEGDPTRRWIVARHLLELIGNTRTHTEELYSRLLDLLYDMANDLDKRQRILILQQFSDSNVPRNNGAIRYIHEKAPGLTPKMSDVLRKLADFTVSEADNNPDEPGWTDVPKRYKETLDDIREAYARHVHIP
ncbi:MAG: hypothetical protein IJD38_03435 [Clostridia bacterium]|nr:hypothetical protein [Clostridia bacterium]